MVTMVSVLRLRLVKAISAIPCPNWPPAGVSIVLIVIFKLILLRRHHFLVYGVTGTERRTAEGPAPLAGLVYDSLKVVIVSRWRLLELLPVIRWNCWNCETLKVVHTSNGRGLGWMRMFNGEIQTTPQTFIYVACVSRSSILWHSQYYPLQDSGPIFIEIS